MTLIRYAHQLNVLTDLPTSFFGYFSLGARKVPLKVRLCSKPSKGFPFHWDWKPVLILWPACCQRSVPCALPCPLLLFASGPLHSCHTGLLAVLSTPASGPLLLLDTHSLILLVLFRYHLPSGAFPDHLFKIVIAHIYIPCPTFWIIFLCCHL